MKKGQDLNDAVGDTTHDLANKSKDALAAAGDYLAPRARDLADYLAPRVKDLAESIADYLEPRARDLGKRGTQFASDTRDNLQPKIAQFASDTRDNLQPKIAQFASDTRDNLQPYVDDAMSRVQPHLDDARARVQPLVETGRDRFEHDVRPRLHEALDNVNAMPQTQEAKRRFAAATAALAGDLALPEPVAAPAKRSKGRTFLQVALASGLLAGVVYAIKRFLAPEDTGWQAHEASPAYRSREDYLAETADTAAEKASDLKEAAEDKHADVKDAVQDKADDLHEAVSTPRRAADAEGDPFVVSPYGEGSHVGDDVPAGFAIKGNERSMKYHVPGSGGYDRTIADVWFETEDAALAAGFTKAQR